MKPRDPEEEIRELPGWASRRMAHLALAGWRFTFSESASGNFRWWCASKLAKPETMNGTLEGVLYAMATEYYTARAVDGAVPDAAK